MAQWRKKEKDATYSEEEPIHSISSVYSTGAASILLGLYLGVAALASGAQSKGQTQDVVQLVFVHFFEHSPGYVVVPLVAAAGYLLLTREPATLGSSLGR